MDISLEAMPVPSGEKQIDWRMIMYSYYDMDKPRIKWLIIIDTTILLLMIIMIIVSLLYAHKWAWVVLGWLLPMAVIVAGLPVLVVRAYHDQVIIDYGKLGIIRIRLPSDTLTKIESLSGKASDYMKWMLQWPFGKWPFGSKDIGAIIASRDSEAICIETRGRRLILSCADAVSTAERLRAIYGIAHQPIEELLG
jgi:hypothetical protein